MQGDMKNMLTSLMVLAVVASAHWTHDDALAREIGPPAGVQDVDVATLSDEIISAPGRKLLQTSTGSDDIVKQKVDPTIPDVVNQPVYGNKDGKYAKLPDRTGNEVYAAAGNADGVTKLKVYRITIGTKWDIQTCDPNSVSQQPGPVNCQLQLKLKGEYNEATSEVGASSTLAWKSVKPYLGPTSLSYFDAGTMAAPLHPGMQAIIVDSTCQAQAPASVASMVASAGFTCGITGMGSANIATGTNLLQDTCTPCESNSKDCQTAVSLMSFGGGATAVNGDNGATYQTGVSWRPASAAMGGLENYERVSGDMNGNTLGTDVTPAMIIQKGQIEYPDVGTIREVQARVKSEDSGVDCGGGWKGKFLKIDTNDIFTGIGNGVYYLPGPNPADGLSVGEGGETYAVEDNQIMRCTASDCEEEMETKLGM